MGVPSFQQLMLPALQTAQNAGIFEDSPLEWAISWATVIGRRKVRAGTHRDCDSPSGILRAASDCAQLEVDESKFLLERAQNPPPPWGSVMVGAGSPSRLGMNLQ
jgi:hypothetical protein